MRRSENVSFVPSPKSLWQPPLWRLCNTVNKSPMDEKCTQLWQKLSSALKPQVSADTFKRWFSAVELVGATDKTLSFRVPNNIYQYWIESNHMVALQAAFLTPFGGPAEKKFIPSEPPMEITEEIGAPNQTDSGREIKSPTRGPFVLNRPKPFNSFVVGPKN